MNRRGLFKGLIATPLAAALNIEGTVSAKQLPGLINGVGVFSGKRLIAKTSFPASNVAVGDKMVITYTLTVEP